ncbi:MAG: branched-chain amino acid ABC transporter permease [Pusillimonas sp.]|nr:branched-chain amino acid ABC transporter permease [Pusillimonas sp.]MBC41335.1 branched-chain amino acid ABC transporter permease [Pusillimonas sp.]HCP78004.1 branched-chain amino acid ABC transporter permease [Pusillimonas sp.]|tara:strand:- start:21927 stop:22850 length:924 start_codon:yes stop_codon:yes gene_type:complete
MNRLRFSDLTGWFVLLIVLAVLPAMLGSYGQGVMLQLFGWIALTASWVAFSGMTGYISLGHAVFYGLGGYVMALSWMTLPIWAILPLAAVVAALFALLVGLPALRVRGPYFVILTFGLAEFVKYIVVAIESSLGMSGRLLLGGPDVMVLSYGMLGLAVLSVVLVMVLRHSRLGMALWSVREDEVAATTLGVPVTKVKLIAFILSAGIPAMVGALTVLRSTYFEPMQMFNPMTSFTIVTMAIIGGSDRPAGPVLGAGFIMLLSELLWSRAPEFYMVLLGVLLLSFVLFAPDGIVGKWQARRRSNGGVS